MKLSRITKPLRSVQVRVTLAGELEAALESYARYYEHVHGDPVEPRALIAEMLRAFIEADREFQTWSRSRSNDRQHPAAPAPVPQTAARTQP
jgi:hypothetical protein